MTATSTGNKRRAFFAGSFNPFTTGHADIVRRGLTVFDHIVIGVGFNSAKGADGAHDANVAAIEALYAGDDRVSVLAYSCLTGQAALDAGCGSLLRGVRTVRDFEYERDLAEINRQLCGLDTVILFSSPELGIVSSSLVRELEHFGADTSKFIPQAEPK